jgi:hypothetical protein
MQYDFTEAITFVVTATDEEIEMLPADPAVDKVEPDSGHSQRYRDGPG